MRPVWIGAVNFGLVNIPVKLYPASQARRLNFDLLRKKDLSPVGYLRVSKTSGEKVDYEDIVKGYEFKKGDYVVLTEDDFKKADVKKTESVEILDFVNEREVPAKVFEKPYFIEPGKGASKVYSLLREALKKSGKAGVARYVLRNSEHLGLIKVEGDAIMLIQIRFASELRNPDELNIPGDAEISEKELKMALSLIEQLSDKFRLDKYRDTYTEELKEMINNKAKGKEISRPQEVPQPTHAGDLMDKLRESLERAKTSGYAGA